MIYWSIWAAETAPPQSAGSWRRTHRFDVVVVPSVSEGFGRMAVEALRASVSVLARPVEGLLEVLDGLAEPWLSADPASWSQHIERARDASQDRHDELLFFGGRFGVDRFVDEAIAGYRRVTATSL